jgi:hypothetical protein
VHWVAVPEATRARRIIIQAEEARCREMFERTDTDGSGTLDKQEVGVDRWAVVS